MWGTERGKGVPCGRKHWTETQHLESAVIDRPRDRHGPEPPKRDGCVKRTDDRAGLVCCCRGMSFFKDAREGVGKINSTRAKEAEKRR